MASIAVLPILIGLAVDYAIQFQARFDEEVAAGLGGVDAVARPPRAGGPTIGTACLATGAGFLALLLSPTPMVRSFGLLLVVGIAIAFGLALTAGFAALSLRSPGGRRGHAAEPTALRLPAQGQPSARRGTRLPLARRSSLAVNRPREVLVVGLALAVLGWGVGTQIESVVRHPRAGPAEHPRGAGPEQAPGRDRGLGRARRQGPCARSDRSGDPEVDGRLQAPRAGANGFSGPNPSCQEAEVCPGPALSDFVVGGGPLRRADIRAALAELPAYDLEQVAPADPQTGLPGHTALLSFGIRAQSLEDQQALIDRVRGGDRRARRAGRAAGRRRRRARRPAGDRRRGGERPLRQPLLADAGRPARRRPGPLRRLPLAAARPRAPGAGRPGQRLVGAGALGRPASRSTRCRRRSAR